MFQDKLTQIRFKKDMLSLKLPEKEKVLPVQALIQKERVVSKHKMAFVGVCAAAVMVILSMFAIMSTNFNLISFNEKAPTVDSSVQSNSPVTHKTVITAGNPDIKQMDNNGIPKSSEIYISDMLKTKFEQYKGQDVLFRVVVELIFTQEEGNAFDLSTYSEVSSDDKELFNKLEEELQGYQKLFMELEAKESQDQTKYSKEIYELGKKIGDIQNEIWTIRQKYLKIYTEQLNIQKIEFAKNLGAEKIEQIVNSSEHYYYEGAAYYMQLTEEMIYAMAKQGGYRFSLALPERTQGYSRKISDSLVSLLEQANDDDIIHVAVVSVIDKTNEFMVSRYIPCNQNYNSDLNKDWQGLVDLNNENIKKYIDAIVARNKLTDKRVINEAHPDVNVISKDVLIAGFEANLTKAQLIALTADQDVKVIYPASKSSDVPMYMDQ